MIEIRFGQVQEEKAMFGGAGNFFFLMTVWIEVVRLSLSPLNLNDLH